MLFYHPPAFKRTTPRRRVPTGTRFGDSNSASILRRRHAHAGEPAPGVKIRTGVDRTRPPTAFIGPGRMLAYRPPAFKRTTPRRRVPAGTRFGDSSSASTLNRRYAHAGEPTQPVGSLGKLRLLAFDPSRSRAAIRREERARPDARQ